MTKLLKIHSDMSTLNGEPAMLIQAGKGKKENQLIYILLDAFIFLDEIIWDHHREYSKNRKNKIKKSDWSRIQTGLMETIKELKENSTKEEVYKTLKLRKHLMQDSTLDFLKQKQDIMDLYQSVIEWINEALEHEKYIMIVKAT